MTPQDFVAKWRRVVVKERSGYQEYFIDLRHLVGSQTPVEADPNDGRFMFETDVVKTEGGEALGHGWPADLTDDSVLERAAQ